MATKKKSAPKENVPAGGWPKITQGSHLTVIEHENGRRELRWDDEALMRDVRDAILKAESVIPAAVEEPKRSRKKKNVKE
jgi:hypothetical protein